MSLSLILTRPRAQQADWAARMAALGVQTLSLPLIEIAAGGSPQQVAQAWSRLPQARLLMFVSPNAVHAFFASRPAGFDWPAETLAATVGPGSAQALLDHGVPAACILQPPPSSPSLDSEHLWPLLASLNWRDRLVFIIRGDGGREWLADRLRESGARVETVSVYSRRCPRFNAQEQALLDRALAQPREHVWLFSSSEAAGNLRQLADASADWSQGLAIATHERIAVGVRALGFVHVVLARPSASAVALALHGLEGGPLQSAAL